MGYSYILKNNQLIILRKLHFIELSNNDIILSKNSQINLGRGNRLSSPPRLFWDLPYTHCPSNKSTQTTAKITKISFGQNGTTCRMVFHLNSHQIAQIEKISKTKSKIQLIRTQYKQPTIAKRKSKSLKGKVIIIDPGHGGSDPGAVTKNKDYEKNYTLDISKRIKKHLERQGAKAILLRKNDTNPSLYQRVIRTNRLNGDFLISVHVNSFINEKAKGTETYYYKKSEKRAAQKIQQQLVKHLKLRNNGIKFAKMYVLKNTKIPGVLIEPCFMTNPYEYQKLKTVAFRENIAKGTVAGLNEYFKN